MMRRDDCLRVLARHHRDQIVVPVYQAAFEWMVIRPHPLTYLGVGAMGQASSHALGLALGCPDRQVLVLDGDGSLLMNLGTLVTIAQAAPRNLVHFVCQNDCYEANGGHPIPGADRVSFAGFARAAGWVEVHEFSELADFEARIGAVLAAPGPTFVTLRVVPGEPFAQDFDALHDAARRAAFREALTRG
jgi:sulfopyruvate decarboxylase subunit beta